jgi:hypothetical protein
MWNNYYKIHESQKSFQLFLEYICIFEYVAQHYYFFMWIYSKPP